MSMPVKEPKTSRSLTATLALAFLALSVVVLFIAGSSQMYFSIQTQREIVAGEQQLIAQEAANTVASFIQEKFSILETAVKFGNPMSAAQKEQKRVLENLLGLERAFRHRWIAPGNPFKHLFGACPAALYGDDLSRFFVTTNH